LASAGRPGGLEPDVAKIRKRLGGTRFGIVTFLIVIPVAAPRLREGTNRRKESAMKTFLKLLKDKSGASAAEYALILAIIGSAIAIAAIGLGGAIGNRMDAASSCIKGGTAESCGAPAAAPAS
jgi:pilus assembly protein Flp/PilA